MVPFWPATLSHLERLRVLTMNSQMYGTHIQGDGRHTFTGVVDVSTGWSAITAVGSD
jgi:hypothetical protein